MGIGGVVAKIRRSRDAKLQPCVMSNARCEDDENSVRMENIFGSCEDGDFFGSPF